MQLVGVDIIEIGRIADAINTRGETFLNRVFTGNELQHYGDKVSSLAARFSAKEAVIKALGCKSLKMTDIEVLSSADGKPIVMLHGKAKERADELGLTALDISLSHSRAYAVAFVVGMSA
jgi:holo-[acyl-carrier protein] synthase